MTETLINGYHKFALCSRDWKEGISFNEFENDLGDGFDDSLLFGSNTGLRKFSVGLPNLPNYSDSRTYEIDGVLLTPAEYLWELFCLQKTTRKRIVVQSQLNNQYYLVKFIDKEFTYDKALVALFSGQAVFQQVRISDVAVFDVSKISRVSHWYKTPIAGATDNAAIPDVTWLNSIPGGDDILAVGGVTYQTNEQNGKAIVRLDTTGGADFLSTNNLAPDVFYEAFLVMKAREATFSHDDGIIANGDGAAGSPALLGSAGTSKFYNLGIGSGYTYKKNGIEYAESDQQAPMNEFGIVHIRNTGGWTMEQGLVFGIDRIVTYPNRKADIDIGEIIICSALLPESVANEVTEYLKNSWGI